MRINKEIKKTLIYSVIFFSCLSILFIVSIKTNLLRYLMSREYYITENPMIIYDTHGERYSVLPADVALYPQGTTDDKGFSDYIMYVNITGEFKHKKTDSNAITPLYLSEFSKGFKRENDEVLTKRDLIRILQKNNISKEDFANIINELKQNKDNE